MNKKKVFTNNRDPRPQIAEFLKKGFVRWQFILEGKRSYAQYARWIGVTPQQMAHYLQGTRLPGPDVIRKISNKLGPRIYDILDQYPPYDDLKILISIWGTIPEEKRSEFVSMAKNEAQYPPPEFIILDGDKQIFLNKI